MLLGSDMDLTDSDKEALRVLANSDLRCSKYAQTLCETFDLDTSQTTTEPTEPTEPSTSPSIDSQNPKESIFAY